MDEKDKTGLYGQEKTNKTGIYTSKEDKKQINTQGISPDDKIILKGKEYSVKKIISQGTGEANLYQIEDDTQNFFALKLYYEFKFESEEPNEIALSRIKKLNDPDILRLIDFGVGADKYNGKYCYEISELMPGGNILEVADFKTKYTPEFIEESIIPQIFLAITKLHEFKIYHCDLKPSNILYKDIEQTDIVIGDYGSAKAYDLESEKGLRKSSTIKGTEFYLSPEQARGIVSGKNDYYSFGMIILHLLYPEAISSDNIFREIDKDKFEQIVERQYNLKPVIEFIPELKRLNTLIEGLTLVNHINRWGEKEIERWLKKETIEISYRSKESSDVKPLEIGPIIIENAENLISYIQTKKTWFQDLFEDQEVFKLIKDWLDSYIGIPDRKRFEKLVNIYKLSGKPILQSAVTMFLLPQQPLKIESQSFDLLNTGNITETVTAYIAKLDSIYKFATIEYLGVYFFQLEYTLKRLHYQLPENQIVLALLYKLYNPISANTKMPDDFDFKTLIPANINQAKEEKTFEYMLGVFHSFNPERPYPGYDNPIKSIGELSLFYLNNENLYSDKYHVFERKALLAKVNARQLADLKFPEFILQTLSDKAEVKIKIDYLSFDKLCNVHYSILLVLDPYLKRNGIDKTMTLKEENGFIYAAQNTGSAGNAAKSFINYMQTEHKSLKLSAESLDEIKKTFITQHNKYFRMNKIVSIVSIVLIIALVVAIIVKLA